MAHIALATALLTARSCATNERNLLTQLFAIFVCLSLSALTYIICISAITLSCLSISPCLMHRHHFRSRPSACRPLNNRTFHNPGMASLLGIPKRTRSATAEATMTGEGSTRLGAGPPAASSSAAKGPAEALQAATESGQGGRGGRSKGRGGKQKSRQQRKMSLDGGESQSDAGSWDTANSAGMSALLTQVTVIALSMDHRMRIL